MANIHRMTKKRLGELLLQEGVINEEQLNESLEEQQQTGELIGDILVRKGFCTESDVARTISTQFSFPYISVMHYYISPELVGLFPLEQLEKNLFVPIDKFDNVLNIVVAGLLDKDIIEDIEKRTGCSAQVYVGMVSEVKQVIKEKFAKKPARKTAGKSAADVNVDVTAPPTEETKATATADTDPALADLEEALKAAGGSPAPQDEAAAEPPEETPGETPQDKSVTAAEDAADAAEGAQEEEPKKSRRFRFFESD